MMANHLEYQLIGHFCLTNRATVPENSLPQRGRKAPEVGSNGVESQRDAEPLQSFGLDDEREWGQT